MRLLWNYVLFNSLAASVSSTVLLALIVSILSQTWVHGGGGPLAIEMAIAILNHRDKV